MVRQSGGQRWLALSARETLGVILTVWLTVSYDEAILDGELAGPDLKARILLAETYCFFRRDTATVTLRDSHWAQAKELA
jgi:hypothetical protein